MSSIRIDALEFDSRNRGHFADRYDERGLDEAAIWEVLAGNPFVTRNADGRTGTHLMIGPTASGRFFTVVILEVDPEGHVWRPITGWPSTERQIRQWHDAS